MAKNGPKVAAINLGVSHMINDNIFNIFCFSTFSFWYFRNPEFWQNLKEITLKTGSRKYAKEKKLKNKNVKNVVIYHMWDT